MDLGTILGIISIIVSIIIYILGNNFKKIIYTKQSKKIITEDISGIENLKIIYNETPIKKLSYTILNIKSTGKDSIEMNDFVEPLCIKTDGKFFVYNIETILTNNSRPSNHIEFILVDQNTIQLKYKIFKYKDLITLNIYHTGNLDVIGELKKGEIIESNSINKKNIADIFTIIGCTLGIFFIILESFIENGYKFYLNKTFELFFNFALGIMLIDFYHRFYKKDSK